MVGSKAELEALQAANDALDRGMGDGANLDLPTPAGGDSDAALAEINRRLG